MPRGMPKRYFTTFATKLSKADAVVYRNWLNFNELSEYGHLQQLVLNHLAQVVQIKSSITQKKGDEVKNESTTDTDTESGRIEMAEIQRDSTTGNTGKPKTDNRKIIDNREIPCDL